MSMKVTPSTDSQNYVVSNTAGENVLTVSLDKNEAIMHKPEEGYAAIETYADWIRANPVPDDVSVPMVVGVNIVDGIGHVQTETGQEVAVIRDLEYVDFPNPQHSLVGMASIIQTMQMPMAEEVVSDEPVVIVEEEVTQGPILPGFEGDSFTTAKTGNFNNFWFALGAGLLVLLGLGIYFGTRDDNNTVDAGASTTTVISLPSTSTTQPLPSTTVTTVDGTVSTFPADTSTTSTTLPSTTSTSIASTTAPTQPSTTGVTTTASTQPNTTSTTAPSTTASTQPTTTADPNVPVGEFEQFVFRMYNGIVTRNPTATEMDSWGSKFAAEPTDNVMKEFLAAAAVAEYGTQELFSKVTSQQATPERIAELDALPYSERVTAILNSPEALNRYGHAPMSVR